MAGFDLTAEIGKVLGEYTTAVQVAVDQAVEDCGKGMQKGCTGVIPFDGTFTFLPFVSLQPASIALL